MPIVDPSYESCTAADRLSAIEQLGALISASTAELLRLIGVADAADDYRLDGATDMAAWLVQALRVSSTTAREWTRAASALEVLPALSAAFDDGVLSWEQVRPATRYADPSTDALLAAELPGHTVRQIEQQAREHRPRRAAEDRTAADRRRFSWWADPDAGGSQYSGFLPTDLAEPLNAVLTRMAEAVGPDPATEVWAPLPVRLADALADLARCRAGTDVDPDSCLAVIHVDGEVAAGRTLGNGMFSDRPVGAETARRLLCDAKVEWSIDLPDGQTVGIGRADRTVPRWLRRTVAHRDGCCRFPGCHRAIRHRHHIRHWSSGGPTNADNLCGLCWEHHHLVHEGGWTITGHPDQVLTFTSPAGRRVHSRPRPVDPAIRHRARSAAGLEPQPPPLPPSPPPLPPRSTTARPGPA